MDIKRWLIGWLFHTHLLRPPPLRWLKPAGSPADGQQKRLPPAGTGTTSDGESHFERDQETAFGHVL